MHDVGFVADDCELQGFVLAAYHLATIGAWKMQDRYTGDIGDYVKYGLLRALGAGSRIGVAWYLYPDEGHNEDGRHTSYFDDPQKWSHLDPDLFLALKTIVKSGNRTVSSIEKSGLLGDAVFAGERLAEARSNLPERRRWRRNWFECVNKKLRCCDLIFADPDNGLCDNAHFSYGRIKDGKRLPLSEALTLAEGRTAILYHHNTRRPGGHDLEVDHWIERLGSNTVALRWNAFSNRTFFVVNPTRDIEARLYKFVKEWASYARLHHKAMK